ncbi:MAG: hypothetical protein A2951_00845 [Candidatus Buchananbacteria bacterium RIFCSPLOWO2_01_FULL_56_15]|uniref:CDP-diacylglycerol--glycerol-3-phosphate 3-phosphatidyltransferase n=2 Tax=Candidatus Buchananiibacteriota TaxID=1817903 RepID=A0A1G1YC90_9BACT|nr:MAG: hypothetical protein A3J59_01690 [Candidatus Buchananbacteria bacterium RIFCSPHIGHO2_02_FULL_56_16]OGY55375.1 MAG: hypothetical protein A2951_00845 [Candidatus Buchananbacteria bacterium RIFCSPLOWO2_01_FULL_56_15]
MQKHGANLITLVRLFGVVLIFIWMPFKTHWEQQIALLVYGLLALTDLLDGRLARSRWGRVTNLGKIIDPLADKLLVLVYLPLVEVNQIAWGFVAILIGRDIYATTLRILAMEQGQVMAAKFTGKLKTAISLPLAAVLICRAEVSRDVSWQMATQGRTGWVIEWVIYLAAISQPVIIATVLALTAVTIWSVIGYSNFRFDRRRLPALVAGDLLLVVYLLVIRGWLGWVIGWVIYLAAIISQPFVTGAILALTGVTVWSIVEYSNFSFDRQRLLTLVAGKLLLLVYLPLIQFHQITSGFVAILIGGALYDTTMQILAIKHRFVATAQYIGTLKTVISLSLAMFLICRANGAFTMVSQSYVTDAIWLMTAAAIASILQHSSFLFDRQRFWALVSPPLPE